MFKAASACELCFFKQKVSVFPIVCTQLKNRVENLCSFHIERSANHPPLRLRFLLPSPPPLRLRRRFPLLAAAAVSAGGGGGGEEAAGRKAEKARQLQKRVLVGVAIGVSAGGIVVAGGWVFAAAVAAAVLAGSREYFELVRSTASGGGTPPPRYVSRACSAMCALMPILTL
jgi:phosphatidate cytidylyltransferase